MIYSIFPTHDATLYEKYSKRNTGIDQILELDKTLPNVPDLDGNYWDSTYNSHILMKFDIPYVKRLIDRNVISKKAKFYLNLKAIEASELPIEYTLYAHPVSKNWVNGQGSFSVVPEITTGVSWDYADGYFFGQGAKWITGSLTTGTTGSYTTREGGGTWFTSSVCSHSFDYVSIPDMRMDVTSIVHQWLSGSIPNYGLLIKHSDELEKSSTYVGSLKFFGRDSHTIYLPKLEASWNDAVLTGTGSLEEVGDNFIIHISNIKRQYRSESKEIFRIVTRDVNPPMTYATSSRFLQIKRLPTSSYYAIQDYTNTDYIVPFNTEATQISVDSKGSYFRLDMNTFLPDRYYKIVIKTIQRGGLVEQIFDDGYYFRVVR